MQVIKEKLEIEESLKKKIKNILSFLNKKGKLINGNVISLPKTNLAYIEPHKLELENNTYLFFNECKEVYINTLEQSIPIESLENHIKNLNNLTNQK